MQHWKVSTAETWENLTGHSYGSFYDLLQETSKRKVADLAILLACEAIDQNPALDVNTEIERLKGLTMADIFKQINAVFGVEAKKKMS